MSFEMDFSTKTILYLWNLKNVALLQQNVDLVFICVLFRVYITFEIRQN